MPASNLPSYSDLRSKFDDAKKEWATRGRLYTVNVIRDQFLSGQALGRRSGTLVRSIDSESSETADSFTVGTNVVYGVAWEFGFSRKAFEVHAINAKALAFQIGGRTVFAKSVKIPAQSFAARPFIQPAIKQAQSYLMKLGADLIGQAILNSFPGSFEIVIGKR